MARVWCHVSNTFKTEILHERGEGISFQWALFPGYPKGS